MSTAGTTSSVRPSVFISYASEDRAAARLLRDTLEMAGLDVWYDERELGGGDAWDQKIRRQIRDCDYFMPVVSATTERRKEGYFRREWRLAAERTMDMADDVLFLLPVAIDDTSEQGARVPEKFLTVQWLRAPGGQRTPAFDALVQRLLAGEHAAPPRPPLIARPTASGHSTPPVTATSQPGPTSAHHHAPPPMPHFPHAPENPGVGQWLKFLAEVVWWGVTAVWVLFSRLPKWLRVVLAIWLVFMLLKSCGNDSTPRSKPKESAPRSSKEVESAVITAAEHVTAALAKGASERDWDKFGEELVRRFGKAAAQPAAAGKRVALLPVSPSGDDAVAQFARRVFATVYGKLLLAQPAETGMARETPAETTDAAFARAAKETGAEFGLGFRLASSDAGTQLAVRLIRASDGAVAWSGDFALGSDDAAAIGDKVADAVLAALPPK